MMCHLKPVEVGPNVFRLGNDLFNWYLIREGRQFTLLDAGLPGYWEQLIGTLAYFGAHIEDIGAVLITHAHLDHVGLASRVARCSGARIYLHPDDAARAAKGGAQLPPRGLLLNAWRKRPFMMLASAALRRGVFFGAPIQSFVPLTDGQVLEVPGQPKVLFVPGHTAGSVAFWLPERGVLFAGDALLTVDLYRGSECRPQLARRGTEENWALASESLNCLRGLGRAVLLPGHGDPWRGDLDEAVELALGGRSPARRCLAQDRASEEP